jgi:YD repeat-containing protein
LKKLCVAEISITDELGNVTQYRYSLLGDVIEVIDALGHSTKYEYDKSRRLARFEQYRLIDDTLAKAKQTEYQVTTYERNKKGEVIAVTSPLGDIVRYGYDKLGNVISKTDEDNLETLYEYNLVGKLVKVCYADGRTVELGYNALR